MGRGRGEQQEVDRTTRELVAYESARDELIERLTLRDNSIFAYIVATGAYFGFILQGNVFGSQVEEIATQASLMIVLPLLSLVFTYITLQHHVMIGKLGEFTRQLMGKDALHWDRFYAEWTDKRYLSARTASQALLLAMPLIYTAIFCVRSVPLALHESGTLLIVALVLMFDAIVLSVIVRLHIWAYRTRKGTDYLP